MGHGGKTHDTCEWSTEYTCYEKVKVDDSYEYVPLQEPPKKKAVWRKITNYLPDGAKTYVIEKVTELLDSEIPDTYTSFAMQYGIDTEPYAIEAIQAAYGITLAHTNEEQVFFNNGLYGATPDGVEYDDDLYTITTTHDVKCPIGTTHTFNRLNVNTADELEKHYPVYLWQLVMQMLCTGAKVAYWHSYRPTHEKHPLHTVRIDRDEAKINALQHRLNLAVALKNQYLNILNKVESKQ
jgi:hypothetical protein